MQASMRMPPSHSAAPDGPTFSFNAGRPGMVEKSNKWCRNLIQTEGPAALSPVAARRGICDDTGSQFPNLQSEIPMPAAFPEINKIPYKGPQSKDPLAFPRDNAGEKGEGKT